MLQLFRLFICDDIGMEHNPTGTLCGLIQTDPTKDDDFHLPMTEGIPMYGTRWARVKINPCLRELIREERECSYCEGES